MTRFIYIEFRFIRKYRGGILIMEHKYLLTYIRKGFSCFQWFSTVEDMEYFIESICKPKDYKIIEKTYIKDAVAL